jgi:hypothetical protein
MGYGARDGTNLQFGGWGRAQPILDKWLQLRYSLVMAVIPAVNREKQMQVKTFDAWHGEEELSRQQYIDRWVSTTYQLAYMFGKYDKSADLIDFQIKVMDLAAAEWDKR